YRTVRCTGGGARGDGNDAVDPHCTLHHLVGRAAGGGADAVFEDVLLSAICLGEHQSTERLPRPIDDEPLRVVGQVARRKVLMREDRGVDLGVGLDLWVGRDGVRLLATSPSD